jgi:phenylacetate-CoA ligase
VHRSSPDRNPESVRQAAGTSVPPAADSGAPGEHGQDRSREALERALGSASAYAGWRRFDPGPQAATDARYAALPALTKRELRRDFPQGFVPAGIDLPALLAGGEVEYVQTSGTSGDAVTLLWSQAWWDASERASWQLNAHARRWMTGTHREAVLASARCVGPPYRAAARTMAERTLGRLLFLNQSTDVEWSDGEVARMAAELARFRPVVLEADPAYLAAFARRAAALGLPLHQPELVVFTYAFATRAHLRQIRLRFAAPLMSSHGSTESGYVFIECEHGRLHQNVASCRVDPVPLKAAHGGPLLVRLLVTPFGHPCFSVLRFDVGDLGLVSETPCACGNREGLVLDALAGRAKDATFTTAGRLVTLRELDEALGAAPALCDYRLEQRGPSAFHFRYVSEQPADDAAVVVPALAALYGPGAQVTAEPVAALVPEPSGKYRPASAWHEVDVDACSAVVLPAAP